MDARRGPFDDFAVATGVLTRLPVGRGGGRAGRDRGRRLGVSAGRRRDRRRSARWPISSPACAASAARWRRCSRSAVGLASTGAFHEDGLADTVDGFGGGRDREHKLAIMRDSRHGTFGILALVLSVGLRAAALAAIGDPIHAGLALVAAHAASRGALPPLMRLLAPARPDGLGAAAGRPTRAVALAAARSAPSSPGTARAVAGIAALLLGHRARSRSRQCLRGGRSAATPATFSAFSSKSERS